MIMKLCVNYGSYHLGPYEKEATIFKYGVWEIAQLNLIGDAQ